MGSNLVENADELRRDNFDTVGQSNFRATARQKKAAKRALAILDASERTFDWEAAREIVSSLLERCADEQQLPPLIERFLEQHWRPYLERLYVVEGPEGPAWRNALEATVTLIWSVQPKCDEESRKRLFALLPQLYQCLYAGLEMIGVGGGDADAFFSELSQLYLVSLHPQEGVTPAPASEEAHEPVVKSQSAESHRESEGEIEETTHSADRHPAQPSSDGESTEAESDPDPIAELRIGSRVEFQSARETRRVMSLKWISGSRSVFVFEDHYTEHELCITSTRLNERLSERSAVALN